MDARDAWVTPFAAALILSLAVWKSLARRRAPLRRAHRESRTDVPLRLPKR